MYPGSVPFIFNGSVPGHKKMFNVRRCSMYTGVQFDRFHCTMEGIFSVKYANSKVILHWTEALYSVSTTKIAIILLVA